MPLNAPSVDAILVALGVKLEFDLPDEVLPDDGLPDEFVPGAVFVEGDVVLHKGALISQHVGLQEYRFTSYAVHSMVPQSQSPRL